MAVLSAVAPFAEDQLDQLDRIPPPLDGAKTRLLDQLTEGLGRDALLWLTGYLAGLARRGEEPATTTLRTQAEREAPATYAATVLYGSQTGHAEHLPTELAARLNESRVQTRLCSASAYPKRELKDERLLLVIISTHGDGDPPDNARDLLEFLSSRRAPHLESLQYAVLALGDSSYPQFCHVGRQVDARLEVLGGRRVLPLAEADVDFETVAEPWTARIAEQGRTLAGRDTAAANAVPPEPRTASIVVGYTRANPFSAEILVNQRITGRDSDRDVCHLELLIENSGLHYQPSDSLGVIPVQADALVNQVLDRLKLQGSEEVEFKGETLPLRRWLTERRELTILTRPFLAAHAGRCGNGPLREALDPAGSDRLRQLLTTWQLPDLLARCPAAWLATDLIAALRPLAPRLYSIASSPLPSDGNEVHLTVAHVDYNFEGANRWGVGSHYLYNLALDAHVRIFVEPNNRFRLPVDGKRDIIMIGPGTGVAPFRAFVQHRAALGAEGRNWLFFGNRHFRSEFLYQAEWQDALAKKTLHGLDVAWSRDGTQRVYVQQCMQEQAPELYAWIKGGAYVYVCGDATHMATDVHSALTRIDIEQGALSEEAAGEWLQQLAGECRYVRDVY
jgi:sulfite reductase (NADPH) flavoprotein alpha-component